MTRPRGRWSNRFGAAGAPLPLVLAVAPNGAVTKGFPGAFDEARLAAALVSPGTARCLKALQDRKLVLLSVQHLSAASNPVTVPVGLVAFQKDPSYARVTEIVVVNAGDRGGDVIPAGARDRPSHGEAQDGRDGASRHGPRQVRGGGHQGAVDGPTGVGFVGLPVPAADVVPTAVVPGNKRRRMR